MLYQYSVVTICLFQIVLFDEEVATTVGVAFDLLLTARGEGFPEPYSSDKPPPVVKPFFRVMIKVSQSLTCLIIVVCWPHGAYLEIVADVILSDEDDDDNDDRVLGQDESLRGITSAVDDDEALGKVSSETIILGQVVTGARDTSVPPITNRANAAETSLPSVLGVQACKRPGIIAKRLDNDRRVSEVITLIELLPYRGPRSLLDLVPSEIVFDCLFEVFRWMLQAKTDDLIAPARDANRPPKDSYGAGRKEDSGGEVCTQLCLITTRWCVLMLISLQGIVVYSSGESHPPGTSSFLFGATLGHRGCAYIFRVGCSRPCGDKCLC
jgi:hypothetical protein